MECDLGTLLRQSKKRPKAANGSSYWSSVRKRVRTLIKKNRKMLRERQMMLRLLIFSVNEPFFLRVTEIRVDNGTALPSPGSLPRARPNPGVKSFFQVLHMGDKGPSTWAAFHRFPRPLSVSWITSGEAGTQTCARGECHCHG